MENVITQRVNEFRMVLGLSVNALSEVVGISQTTLNQQLKDDGRGVQISTILLILEAYPNLSAEWLLRGEGSMERTKEKGSDKPDTELVAALKDHIATLKAEVEILRREKNPWGNHGGGMVDDRETLKKVEK